MKRCVKCGGRKVRIQWHKKVEPPYVTCCGSQTEEHMLVKCGTCEYYWIEPPIDAQEEPEHETGEGSECWCGPEVIEVEGHARERLRELFPCGHKRLMGFSGNLRVDRCEQSLNCPGYDTDALTTAYLELLEDATARNLVAARTRIKELEAALEDARKGATFNGDRYDEACDRIRQLEKENRILWANYPDDESEARARQALEEAS